MFLRASFSSSHIDISRTSRRSRGASREASQASRESVRRTSETAEHD